MNKNNKKEIVFMEKYNLSKGFYQNPKLAEINWQDRIEKVCEKNGLNLCWWELLGHEHDLFMDFLEIYYIEDKNEFMYRYVDYVQKLIETVNMKLKERFEIDS